MEMRKSGPYRYNGSKKVKPEASSTRGYCQDNFFRQTKHLPSWIIKLTTGINSYHFNCWLQKRQWDRPLHFLKLKNRPSGSYRKASTFKKLPTIRPKIKRKTAVILKTYAINSVGCCRTAINVKLLIVNVVSQNSIVFFKRCSQNITLGSGRIIYAV